jgi:branched-chain amino acid transport system substrate-binding protein
VSYESQAKPIKLGYLFDFLLPDGYPEENRLDLTRPFELVFRQAHERGVLDRPVEIVFREVEGLPKGSAKAVIGAYGELVEEGCLAVFGPAITDNAVPTREAIESRFHVPAIPPHSGLGGRRPRLAGLPLPATERPSWPPI